VTNHDGVKNIKIIFSE